MLYIETQGMSRSRGSEKVTMLSG